MPHTHTHTHPCTHTHNAHMHRKDEDSVICGSGCSGAPWTVGQTKGECVWRQRGKMGAENSIEA